MVDMRSVNEFLDTKVSMSILLSSVAVTLGLSYALLGLRSVKRKCRAKKEITNAGGEERDEGWETDDSTGTSPGILDSFDRDDGKLHHHADYVVAMH